MSFKRVIRAPLTIGLALAAVAAACLKKSRGKSTAPVHVADQPAQSAEDRAEELAHLSRRLLISGEEEKARIARDLHDGLGSTLTAVNLDLYWVQQRLADQPALASRLTRAIEVLASTVEMKRRIIHSLRPAALDNLGLCLAIESHVAEFEKTCPVPIEMNLPSELPALSSQAAIALFRIYQEALNKAVQHAGATSIAISLRDERGAVILTVTDDGDCVESEAVGEVPAALGLLLMRERAAALEGTLTIGHGADGRGTVVTAWLPCYAGRNPAKNLAAKF
jgi:signal transduction histidine kinase